MPRRAKFILGSTVRFRGCDLTSFDKGALVVIQGDEDRDYVNVVFPPNSSMYKGTNRSYDEVPQIVKRRSLQNIYRKKKKEEG